MPAVAQLRSGLVGLSSLSDADVARIFAEMTSAPSMQTLHEVIPDLVASYGNAAATLAADWYDEHREDLEVPGDFRAQPADLGDAGANALVGWATDTATDTDALLTLVAGGVQRRIVNYARRTVMDASIADPAATGWRRYASAGACAFCRMLAGRGAVYRQATADFSCHDHCHCVAAPAFAS